MVPLTGTVKNTLKVFKITHRFVVNPEGHPRDDDDDEAGEVDRVQEVGHLSAELELHTQATVCS